MNLESLTKAAHDAEFLRLELLDAHQYCTPLESLALTPLIRQAAELSNAVAALRRAMGAP